MIANYTTMPWSSWRLIGKCVSSQTADASLFVTGDQFIHVFFSFLICSWFSFLFFSLLSFFPFVSSPLLEEFFHVFKSLAWIRKEKEEKGKIRSRRRRKRRKRRRRRPRKKRSSTRPSKIKQSRLFLFVTSFFLFCVYSVFFLLRFTSIRSIDNFVSQPFVMTVPLSFRME